jgi:hypothetical protein
MGCDPGPLARRSGRIKFEWWQILRQSPTPATVKMNAN